VKLPVSATNVFANTDARQERLDTAAQSLRLEICNRRRNFDGPPTWCLSLEAKRPGGRSIGPTNRSYFLYEECPAAVAFPRLGSRPGRIVEGTHDTFVLDDDSLACVKLCQSLLVREVVRGLTVMIVAHESFPPAQRRAAHGPVGITGSISRASAEEA
jgi:hypothetical protein